MSETYNQVHYRLLKERGDASRYLCRCGAPARDWAYQHNGTPEIYDPESGRPYSENIKACYAPMCRSCHFKMDTTDVQRKLGQLLGRGNAIRALQDEEFATKLSEDRANAAREANKIRRTCSACGLTTHPAAIGAHQKGSGHQGFIDRKDST
jgi:hypothetical protein